MAYVLCTGVDPALMATRKLLLERAGHTVFTAADERELTSACQQIRFDVAVVGQSMSTASKERIAAAIRKSCPGVRSWNCFLRIRENCWKTQIHGWRSRRTFRKISPSA